MLNQRDRISRVQAMEAPAHQTDYVSAAQYIGGNIKCNAIQTYDPQVGQRERMKPPAGTSIRVSDFYKRNGIRSYRTEEGFKDFIGVPTWTEKRERRSLPAPPSARSARSVSDNTPEQDVYLHPFTQPDLNDPRFATPGLYKTSYKTEFQEPGQNLAREAGKSHFRIG
ncbi:unnamed protein product [Amoebophrya sp. A25]|nr:unnamed protein product [Amoebophrya sp. A25]|eukprot:GSA25T00003137001.1